MRINDQFDERIVVHSSEEPWLPSPMAGVSRRPLDRVGGEVARATTIVKYEPGSHFSAHVHTGGEEFVVLDGVFQDEHGDFPVGSYIRNPPESKHTPGSKSGCIIFVKLWQFDLADRTHVRLRTDHMAPVAHKDFDGVGVTPLYIDESEEVSLFTMAPNARIELDVAGGAELLVIDGEVKESGDTLIKQSWLRVPKAGRIEAVAGPEGAKCWMKTGHLSLVEAQIERVQSA